jgi:hypothetical protein
LVDQRLQWQGALPRVGGGDKGFADGHALLTIYLSADFCRVQRQSEALLLMRTTREAQ